jgi:drug/metabolite transporter (DMT)-like permease
MKPTTSAYLKGATYGLAAVSIWAGWSAVTRLAVTTRLDAWDVTALRFGVAGVILAPFLVRRSMALDRLGWPGLALLIAGGGAPYVLLAAGGLKFAPAHDQAALNPGFMPLFVALFAAGLLGEHIANVRKCGLGFILAGALVIVGAHATETTLLRTFGHALFLGAALLWACFTVIMRQAKLEPLHATALVAVGSAVTYLPLYFAMHGTRLAQLPLADLAVQTLFQGVLVTIVSLVFYGRSIAVLGTSGGAAFGALVPALSALFAILLLGEWPSTSDWIGIAAVSIGVYMASGGPVPGILQAGVKP